MKLLTPGRNMNIPWDAILALVTKLLEDCEPDPAKRLGTLRRPRGIQALRFEKAVREEMGLTPREWRHQGGDVMAAIYMARNEATDADLKEIVDRCDCGQPALPA